MTPCLSVAHDLRSSSREERPCNRKYFLSISWYFSQHNAKGSPLMSLRIPVVSLAAASSRSPLADDAVCQLKDTSKNTNPCFCQTHKHNFVKKYHWLTTRTNLARRSIEAAPGITQTCTTCPIALSLRSEHWCVTLGRKLYLEVWFLPLSQLDLFPNAEYVDHPQTWLKPWIYWMELGHLRPDLGYNFENMMK